MKILVVEDELAIAEGLKFNFEQEGYEAFLATDGQAALALLNDDRHTFKLVILDLMLPGMSGYEICKAIRENDELVPIMVLSARRDSQDKAHAFDCGADQYVTKPFDLNEVLSRVKNLLRRKSNGHAPQRESKPVETQNHVIRFDEITVDKRSFEVNVGENVHSLTTMEMQLLAYFIENEGTVLSRAELLEDVWNERPDITTRSIDNFVMRLRKILEKDPSKPSYIRSIRGTGYRFVVDSPIEYSAE